MGSGIVLTLALLLCALPASGLLYLWWAYLATPITELRTVYTYQPRGTRPGHLRQTGLEHPGVFPFDKLPGALVVALLLHEDDLFFCHRGFNWREIRTRMRHFLRTGTLAGGSGITQQLAKNLRNDFMSDAKTAQILRKIRETGWTLALEKKLSKFEILSLYIDCVCLGPGPVYGFQEAASLYFHKRPSHLSLEEIFFLVGILPGPVRTIRSLSKSEGTKQIRYRQAYIKFCEIYRLAIARQSWGDLEDLGRLPLHEAVGWMRCHDSYVPQGMPYELEISLESRAMEATERLRLVIESLASRLADTTVHDARTGSATSAV